MSISLNWPKRFANGGSCPLRALWILSPARIEYEVAQLSGEFAYGSRIPMGRGAVLSLDGCYVEPNK